MTAILFLCVRVFLFCLHELVAKRAATLESRFATIASVTEKLAKFQAGNDWLANARAQQKLLAAADQVERAEVRWHRVQGWTERLAAAKAWMAGEKGKSRAAWYVICVFDVNASAFIFERLGQHTSRALAVAMESVQAWL